MAVFGRRNAGGSTPPPPEPPSPPQPAQAPDAIARSLLEAFKGAYTDQRGCHLETLYSAMGALAGFGCQAAVREAIVKPGILPADQAFVTVRTKDGGTYLFGDQINQPLLEARTSVWAHIAGALQRLGETPPDIEEIVGFVAQSVGTSRFGTLRMPPEHQPHETPMESLTRQWASGLRVLDRLGYDPGFTGWYFAMSAQLLLLETKDILDPLLAARIFMESAVAMSKVDPAQVPGA